MFIKWQKPSMTDGFNWSQGSKLKKRRIKLNWNRHFGHRVKVDIKIIVTWMNPLNIGFNSKMDEWYLFITVNQLDIKVCPVEERSEAASSKRDGAFWGTEILKPGIWNPISLNGIIFKKLVTVGNHSISQNGLWVLISVNKMNRLRNSWRPLLVCYLSFFSCFLGKNLKQPK